jgi:hypothetical protein
MCQGFNLHTFEPQKIYAGQCTRSNPIGLFNI